MLLAQAGRRFGDTRGNRLRADAPLGLDVEWLSERGFRWRMLDDAAGLQRLDVNLQARKRDDQNDNAGAQYRQPPLALFCLQTILFILNRLCFRLHGRRWIHFLMQRLMQRFCFLDQGGRGRHTVARLLAHHLVEQRLVLPHLFGKVGHRRLDVLHDHFDRGVSGVGTLAGQHFVEQDAEAVYIGSSVHLHAFGLLGTHIERAAQDGSRGSQLGVDLHFLGNAKVAQQGGTVATEKNVLRLDVSVNNSPLVSEIQRAADVHQQLKRLQRIHSQVDAVFQVAAVDVFHRDPDQISGGADIEDCDDVRMLEGGDDPPLVHEALDEGRAVALAGGHGLETDVPVQGLLDGKIDRGHAAATDGLLYLEARDVHRQRV